MQSAKRCIIFSTLYLPGATPATTQTWWWWTWPSWEGTRSTRPVPIIQYLTHSMQLTVSYISLTGQSDWTEAFPPVEEVQLPSGGQASNIGWEKSIKQREWPCGWARCFLYSPLTVATVMHTNMQTSISCYISCFASQLWFWQRK